MQLSKYQEEILNYFSENKQKNIGVSAFAGTGKTFIIERMTEISDTRDIYLAFNNTIAEEFKTKIKNPKTSVMTVHALAYSIMNYNLSKGCSSSGKGGAVGVNIFYGVTANAAIGIANQVNAGITQFVTGFQQAFNPQLTKAEAAKDREYQTKTQQ